MDLIAARDQHGRRLSLGRLDNHIINAKASDRALLLFFYGRLQRLSNETTLSNSIVEMATNRRAATPWIVDREIILTDEQREAKQQREDGSPYLKFILATETALESALEQSFSAGGHNHQLMSSACMELVLLYGNGPVRGLEGAHRDLACFYLRQAATIRAKYHSFSREAQVGVFCLLFSQLAGPDLSVIYVLLPTCTCLYSLPALGSRDCERGFTCQNPTSNFKR